MNDAGRVFKVQIKGTENKTLDSQRTGLGRYMVTTATGATKPATLESGATVYVPLFINEGDVIRVNTERGDYITRVSAG